MTGAIGSTDINGIQRILFEALRKCAKLTTQDVEGASLLVAVMSESFAAIVTEMCATGTVLREPGGPDKVVAKALEPIEKMLRENIADYLAKEAKATRQ